MGLEVHKIRLLHLIRLGWTMGAHRQVEDVTRSRTLSDRVVGGHIQSLILPGKGRTHERKKTPTAKEEFFVRPKRFGFGRRHVCLFLFESRAVRDDQGWIGRQKTGRSYRIAAAVFSAPWPGYGGGRKRAAGHGAFRRDGPAGPLEMPSTERVLEALEALKGLTGGAQP